jgi:hypothetical protein
MIRKLRGRRVLVSTPDETFRGTLVGIGLRHIRLAGLEVAVARDFLPADGHALIPRRRINWIQEL